MITDSVAGEKTVTMSAVEVEDLQSEDIVLSVVDDVGDVPYAGLTNPGSLCYMNCILQQLQMMPHFMRQVISCPAAVAAMNSATKGDEDGSSSGSFFEELIVTLLTISNTEDDCIDIMPLWRAYNGNVGDIDTQHDAAEFLLDLLNTIDSGTTPAACLTESIGGELIHIFSAEEGWVMEKRERFYFIGVDVGETENGSLNDLPTALAAYFQPQTLPFRWPADKNGASNTERVKLTTTKSMKVSCLPKHLVVHLRRFRFDFSTGRKVKLCCHFEFPQHLDMKPFMASVGCNAHCCGNETGGSESQLTDDKSGSWYQLSGCVVHAGRSADRGHYYSLVRDRNTASNDFDDGAWWKFDDEIVTPFDPSEISDEAFGCGADTGINDDTDAQSEEDSDICSDDDSESDNNARCAMLLVYDLISNEDIWSDHLKVA